MAPQHAITYNSKLTLDEIYVKMSATIKLIPKNIYSIGPNKYKIVYTPNDFESASSPDMLQLFKENEIEAIQHASTLYQRTILIRRIDSYITATNSEALITIINELNDFTTTEVHKLPGKDHMIKLTLASLDDVQKAKTDGVRFKYTRAAPEYIHSESTPYRALICLKCYKINMHSTGQCKSEDDVCSKCAQKGHRYKECRSNFLRCLNCYGPHCCMTRSCPALKKATRHASQPAYQHASQQSSSPHPPPMNEQHFPPLATHTSYQTPQVHARQLQTTKPSNPAPLMSIPCRQPTADFALRPILYKIANDLCAPSDDLPRFTTTFNSLLKANSLPTINISAELLEEFTPAPPSPPPRTITPIRHTIRRNHNTPRTTTLECSQDLHEQTYVHQSTPNKDSTNNATQAMLSCQHNSTAMQNSNYLTEAIYQQSPIFCTPPTKAKVDSPTHIHSPNNADNQKQRTVYQTRSTKKALLPTPFN